MAPPFVKFSNNDDGSHPHEMQRQNSGNSILQGNSISVNFPVTDGFSNPGFHGSSDELNLNLQHVLYSGSLPRSRNNILEIFGQNIPESAFDEYTQENSTGGDGDVVHSPLVYETGNTQQENSSKENLPPQSKSSTLRSVGYLSPEPRTRSASDAAALESIDMQGLTNPMFDSGMGSPENGRPLTYAYIEGEEDSNYGSASSDDYASISNYTQKLEGFDVGESNDYDSVGEEQATQNWHLTTEAKDHYANAAIENTASNAPKYPIKSVYLHTPSQSMESHPQILSHQDSTLSVVQEEYNEVYEAQHDYNYVTEDTPRVHGHLEYDYVGRYDDCQNDRDEPEQCYYENTDSLRRDGSKSQKVSPEETNEDYDYAYGERTVHANNIESLPRTLPEYNYVWDMGEPSNYYDDARSLDLTPDSLDPDYEYVSQTACPSHNNNSNNINPPLHERSFGNANSIEFLDDPTNYKDERALTEKLNLELDSSHKQSDDETDQPCYEYVRDSTISSESAVSEQTSNPSQDPDDPPYYDSVRASTLSSESDKSKQSEPSSHNLNVPSANENRVSIVSYESIGSATVPPEFADHIYDEIHRKTLLEMSHEFENGSNQRDSDSSNLSHPNDKQEHYDEILRQSMTIESDLENNRISQSSNISHSTSKEGYESDYETFSETIDKVNQSCENISQDFDNHRISSNSNTSHFTNEGEYESDYETFSEAIAKVHQKSCENIPKLPENDQNSETIHSPSGSTENIYTNEPLYDDVCPIEPGEKVKRLSSFISSLPPPLPLKSFSAVRRPTDSDSEDENYMDMSHDTSHDRSCDMTDEPIEDYSPMSPGPEGLEFQRSSDPMFPEDVTAF